MISLIYKNFSRIFFLGLLYFVPLVSFAAPVCEGYASGRPREFKDFICLFTDLINLAIPVIVGLMLLVFFWGLAKFIFRVGGDEKAVEEGKHIMVWGIIGLFVTVSIYGIISFFYSDFVGNALYIPPKLPTF